MKISALDLSLTGTGYAIGTCSTPGTRTIGYGTLSPKKLSGMPRLDWIRSQIAEVVKGSELVVCEGYAFGRPNQAHQLGELHGLISFWLYKHEIPELRIQPTTLKKFVTGKGNAQKDMMLMEIFDRFGHKGANNNEADAIGLLYMGLASKGLWTPTTREQRSALEGLKHAA
jgi:crossover junction endodeoxyribonuclease RuvC